MYDDGVALLSVPNWDMGDDNDVDWSELPEPKTSDDAATVPF